MADDNAVYDREPEPLTTGFACHIGLEDPLGELRGDPWASIQPPPVLKSACSQPRAATSPEPRHPQHWIGESTELNIAPIRKIVARRMNCISADATLDSTQEVSSASIVKGSK
jgi:hypothetical protein